jgi:hypothetical protein
MGKSHDRRCVSVGNLLHPALSFLDKKSNETWKIMNTKNVCRRELSFCFVWVYSIILGNWFCNYYLQKYSKNQHWRLPKHTHKISCLCTSTIKMTLFDWYFIAIWQSFMSVSQ